jgi:hypothetical protein
MKSQQPAAWVWRASVFTASVPPGFAPAPLVHVAVPTTRVRVTPMPSAYPILLETITNTEEISQFDGYFPTSVALPYTGNMEFGESNPHVDSNLNSKGNS